MNVVLHIPDDVAAILGGDVERQALEALALEAYRAGRLAKAELRRMLGFATRSGLDAFLRARTVTDAPEPEVSSRGRMSVEQMLAFGSEIAAMPILDVRPPCEIMEDLNAA